MKNEVSPLAQKTELCSLKAKNNLKIPKHPILTTFHFSLLKSQQRGYLDNRDPCSMNFLSSSSKRMGTVCMIVEK